MRGIIRFFLILFFGGRKVTKTFRENDGLMEIPNIDDEGRTFQFKKFVFTSVGKVILNNGDYVCHCRGNKFVVDIEGIVNKNLI